MKYFLLSTIRLYWIIFPANKRRPCIFAESCSKFVYRITVEEGVCKGLLALRKRYCQCRPGYIIHKDENSDSFELFLKDGSIVKEVEISQTLLLPYKSLLIRRSS